MDNMEWTPLVDGESEINVEPINRVAEYANLLNEGKVDKVTGKGLSTNDFTDSYEKKLNELPEGKVIELDCHPLDITDFDTFYNNSNLGSITEPSINTLVYVDGDSIYSTVLYIYKEDNTNWFDTYYRYYDFGSNKWYQLRVEIDAMGFYGWEEVNKVDDSLSSTSTNPVQNKVIYNKFLNYTTTANVNSALNKKANITYVDSKIGDVETALDNIIALQNSLIGGDA